MYLKINFIAVLTLLSRTMFTESTVLTCMNVYELTNLKYNFQYIQEKEIGYTSEAAACVFQFDPKTHDITKLSFTEFIMNANMTLCKEGYAIEIGSSCNCKPKNDIVDKNFDMNSCSVKFKLCSHNIVKLPVVYTSSCFYIQILRNESLAAENETTTSTTVYSSYSSVITTYTEIPADDIETTSSFGGGGGGDNSESPENDAIDETLLTDKEEMLDNYHNSTDKSPVDWFGDKLSNEEKQDFLDKLRAKRRRLVSRDVIASFKVIMNQMSLLSLESNKQDILVISLSSSEDQSVYRKYFKQTIGQGYLFYFIASKPSVAHSSINIKFMLNDQRSKEADKPTEITGFGDGPDGFVSIHSDNFYIEVEKSKFNLTSSSEDGASNETSASFSDQTIYIGYVSYNIDGSSSINKESTTATIILVVILLAAITICLIMFFVCKRRQNNPYSQRRRSQLPLRMQEAE